MKLGALTRGFKLPLDESLILASQLGLDGVQIYATVGEFSAETITPERKEELKALLREKHLEVSALCGDMGGFGFQLEKDNPVRIQKTKDIIDLAAEFGSHVVTTHIGVIPADKGEARYGVMLRALTECGLYAKSRGVTMAIETGPEDAKTLLAFLEDTKGGVGVNLDPANFVMVTDQDPVEAVHLLGKYIVHTHAKDGVMLQKTSPKRIYDYFADHGIEGLNVKEFFKEVPLGEGKVNFPAYIKALKEVGYDGYLTIERETGEKPIADIQKAIDTLKPLM